ncbi:MAG: dockerin type I repeat-containing protein [Oscillospiraceae bacterium]|nr:dockerin type I repeat-containing protein [Oscillospiraceae bacterium]
MKRSVKTKRVLAAVLSSVFAFPAAGIFDGNQNSSSVYAEMTTNETYTCQDDEIAEEAVESDWRITKGDINGDGAIDISDATMLSLYLVGEKYLYGPQLRAADVNNNKDVELADLAAMKQFISKKINSFAEVDICLSDEEVSEILPENAVPYAYPEDIKTDNVKVYKLADGTLKVLYLNGRFTMELPEIWEGHFVVDDRCFCSKLSYNGYTAGELFTCIPQNTTLHLSSNMALSAPYMAQIRGISGEIFLYTSGVSVINYDYDNEECRSEYEMLSATLPDVYKSVRSYSDETGKMEAVFDLPEYDCFTGTVSDFLYGKDKVIWAYDEDYALDQNEQEDEHRLCEMKIDTNIVARRAVCLGDIIFYDCYDQKDGTHYGWIRVDAIYFNSNAGK